MAQDYAKTRKSGSKSGKSPRKSPSRSATSKPAEPTHHWSWFFSGLFSGVLICIVGYVALTQIKPGVNTPKAPVSQSEEESESRISELEFYEYLPQAEVEVNVVPVDVAQEDMADASPDTYLLQAASFQDRSDAEALRARIILMNLDARIQPTPISGVTWYRVQAGPFVGRTRVEDAERTLIENNINPIRLKISSE